MRRTEREPADRAFGAAVIRRQRDQLRRGLTGLRREGFAAVHTLRGPEEISAATITRTKLYNDLRHEAGPFDVIGDVHGCRAELEELLGALGYAVARDAAGRAAGARHSSGRRAVFVGDLVDRGPDTPGVLRLVMGMVAAGDAFCVPGNHENKLLRALRAKSGQHSKVQRQPRPGRVAGAARSGDRRVPAGGSGLPGRPDLALPAGRRTAGGRARRPDRAVPGPRIPASPSSSACTARRPARPTSTGCRSATRGRRSTAARRWWHTGTPRCRPRSG